MNGENFLADVKNRILHNLDHEKNECGIDTIMKDRMELPFKTIEEAKKHKDYEFCEFCFTNKFEWKLENNNNNI